MRQPTNDWERHCRSCAECPTVCLKNSRRIRLALAQLKIYSNRLQSTQTDRQLEVIEFHSHYISLLHTNLWLYDERKTKNFILNHRSNFQSEIFDPHNNVVFIVGKLYHGCTSDKLIFPSLLLIPTRLAHIPANHGITGRGASLPPTPQSILGLSRECEALKKAKEKNNFRT